MARNCVPVYSRNATSTAERALHYTTAHEAEQMIVDGKAKRVSRPSAPLKIQLIQLVTPDVNSPCAISYEEMLANVGIGSTMAVRMAQLKVDMWNIPSHWKMTLVTRKAASV